MQNTFHSASKPDIPYTIDLMKNLHEGQTDHSGKPYYLHPLRVAANAIRIYPQISEEEVMGILLHDVIEDCEGADKKFLRDKGYSEDTIQIVSLMTKPDGDTRDYTTVIDDLIAAQVLGAIIGKIADNMDNLHPERTKELREKKPEKAEKLANRYKDSIVKLCNAAKIDPDYVDDLIQNKSPDIHSETTVSLEQS